MDLATFLSKMKNIGLRTRLTNTGHSDFQRVFIMRDDNVTIGRASIYKGNYSHIKWYLQNPEPLANEGQRLSFYHQVLWVIEMNKKDFKLDLDMFDILCKRTATAIKEDKAEKQAWRDANPRPNGKNRARLSNAKFAPYFFTQLARLMDKGEEHV